MDQDPRNNQPPTNHNHRLQYHWLSPLRDIQPDIFSLEAASNPEDNPIFGIDPELFAERATHTSARTGTSTNSGYQTQQYWSHPPRDDQSGILYPEPATNPENNPTFGVDPAPLTERATHPSTNAGPNTHSGFQLQDTQTTNQSGSWPTMSIANTNQPSNRNSLNNDTRWPAYQGLNLQNMEPNTRTSSATSARPNTKHAFNQPTGGQGPRIQTQHTTPNIGTSPGCSNINWEHNYPWEGESLRMEAPHTPHHRTGLSQTYSNISVSNINTPTVPNNIPPTHTGMGVSSNQPASGNHGDQHTSIVPVIRRTTKQLGNQRGHNHPLEGTAHHTRNPQIPHQRIHTVQPRPGTSGDNSNGQIKSLDTPSASPETTLPSTSTTPTLRNFTPQRTKGNISPIRFPTPEPENLPTSSNLDHESSNGSINSNAP